MNIKIRYIILWPKDKEKEIRKIKFEDNKINVITGNSQTGKSALISIIDYCLGSEKCAIPTGVIREKTSWFGLIVKIDNREMLLARKEPGENLQSTEMYMQEGNTISIIDKPFKNCNLNAVKTRLNNIVGLPSLNFNGEDETQSFGNKPSVRDMVAFNFQSQHIIANPYTLFFKADTYEHQEKLKYIFPLILGAIDKETLFLRKELRELEKELKIKQKELLSRKKAANTWLGEIKSFYSKAIEFGLLSDAPNPSQHWEITTYINYLNSIIKNIKSYQTLTIKVGNTERAVEELNVLINEEYEISYELRNQKLKLLRLEKLKSSEEEFDKTLQAKQRRLDGIDWFIDKINKKTDCPFCGNQSEKAYNQINKLKEASNELQESTNNIIDSHEVLDKEIIQIKILINTLEKNLNNVRRHRSMLEEKSDKVQSIVQTQNEIYRFIGKLEQSLENINLTSTDSELDINVKNLEGRIKEIQSKIDPESIKQKTNYALSKITNIISHYTGILGVENPESLVRVDIANLTLKISSERKREDFLWEIGSGANWMGYHISSLLSLHEYFISIKDNAVPSFIVFDQPSQVYFPEQWPGDNDENKDEDITKRFSDDIKRVNQIFSALSLGINRTNNNLQIIVIEHADEITWKNIKNVHLVERWRGEEALIPKEWI
ncbi:DUF3732 domain-containing protein [Peribacillus sp. R9-11]|uniref:DUF3732 domain-containing protein n=1 Tax=Peribacillus sp. R9-11 TaxID=3073271 RepID=UPI0028697E4E|nr:DUF3732 domain-containing protein [Peribacillus sp. R9-11]WMX58965.1 DUF3732 domain-containing protein [Peribacillus sp. R9-11]